MRQCLPNRRGSLRFSIDYGGTVYAATLGQFDDGRLAEIFIDCHKPSSQLAVHVADAAILASKTITLEKWRTYAYAGSITGSDNPETKQRTFVRAAKDLQRARLIGVWNDAVWIV
jgi:hypothetical protein